MIKSLITALLVVIAPLESSAGFVTGYVTGAAGSNAKSSSGTGMVVESPAPGRDVIMCHTTNGYECWGGGSITPYAFAVRAGYRTVHRIGAALGDGRQYILMEVSR